MCTWSPQNLLKTMECQDKTLWRKLANVNLGLGLEKKFDRPCVLTYDQESELHTAILNVTAQTLWSNSK